MNIIPFVENSEKEVFDTSKEDLLELVNKT